MAFHGSRLATVGVMGLAIVMGWNLQSPTARAEEGKTFETNVGGVEGAGGSITGKVTFNGEQKPRRPINMAADKYCLGAHTSPPQEEKYVFGKDNALVNVFVWVSKGAPTGGTPIHEAEVDQQGCVYVPHVVGVVTDREFKILNGDSTLHNVNFKSNDNGTMNEGMPVKGMEITKKFSKEEIGGTATLKCDVHPWMQAYLQVVSHPYFAVTQEDGTFTIKGLPPGDYEVSVWHELKVFKPDQNAVKVTVEEGKAAEVNFVFSPPGK
ncbi:MAG: hypothetical protein GC164_08090 [Phycisphaera sp.]|nr:hypothetical protein [Phycisphaera sp.]